MRIFIAILLLLAEKNIYGQQLAIINSPLADYNKEWNENKFTLCNTAAGITYLSENEKKVIYIINLVRTYPQLFCKTVLKNYPQLAEKEYLLNDKLYYQSLVKELLVLPQKQLLTPDKLCFASAFCHACTSGKSGYTGHDRFTNACKENEYYLGECCSYGYDDPLEIVMQLLIDEDVPSLGHRRILLNDYHTIGVSILPHSKYSFNAVIDLH